MEFDRGLLIRLLSDDLDEMGFDREGGDDIVEVLCESVTEYLPELRSAVAAAGMQEVGFFAHALKGTFNNFSAPQFTCLAEIFKAMEEEAKGDGNVETINAQMGRVESELKACLR